MVFCEVYFSLGHLDRAKPKLLTAESKHVTSRDFSKALEDEVQDGAWLVDLALFMSLDQRKTCDVLLKGSPGNMTGQERWLKSDESE